MDEAAHQFGALNTLLLVVLLGLCILSAYLIKRNKLYFLPESAAAILVGMLVGGTARLLYPTKDELDFLSLNTEMFFFVLLPVIIFEAGYTVQKQHFFSNLGTIMLFAVFGTLVSTFIVGYLTYLGAAAGLLSVDASKPMELLMFGALISAVDPVATLSIMGSAEVKCDPLLYSLVFGESVLNDAVSIVLFHTFLHERMRSEVYTAMTLPATLLNFVGVSLGSLSVGALIALSCSFVFKHTRIRDYPKFEISLLFLFAYGCYAFAEAINMSGIMALFFNGLILSHYNTYNLSSTAQVTAESIFESMATLSEFFVYIYMGMGVFTGRFKGWDPLFVVLAVVFCLVARMFNTFPFSFLANLWRKQKITGGMQVVMWFSGLRGAIAFALSQSMPGPSKDVYASTTLMVVLITTLVCGGLTEPLLTRMKVKLQPATPTSTSHSAARPPSAINNGSDYDADEEGLVDSPGGVRGSSARASLLRKQDGGLHESGHSSSSREGSRHGGRWQRASMSAATGLWQRVDVKFLQPLFGGPSSEPVDRRQSSGRRHRHRAATPAMPLSPVTIEMGLAQRPTPSTTSTSRSPRQMPNR
ncbi:Sodium/hydrogen exchanger family-domain-containing protein [Tribonema minus]|uniref:Sodium/hydrogen exchanger n=1 Tax=Tribonema minus TaxID=303371 RepID=A0A835YPM8_9STRA|nr:Sodium/hydrogen exchanger family-domain-containing protein [Tribonema minus]